MRADDNSFLEGIDYHEHEYIGYSEFELYKAA